MKCPPDIPNCLTFDVEEWNRVNYAGVDQAQFANAPHRLDVLMGRLLELCRANQARCTFFVLGTIAESFPEVVKEIAAAGHEVASHGYSHRSLRDMTPAEFADDLRRSCGLLEDLTGEKIRGFRAPSYSVTEETLPWFYQILEQQGLAYSSSVFPGRTFLYGIPNFESGSHRPVIEGREVGIVEFPLPCVRLLGFDQGLYVRLFPAWFLRRRIMSDNAAGRSTILYVHPREIDPDQPRLPLKPATAFIHYFGIKRCEKKLNDLLRTTPGRFVALMDILDELYKTRGNEV